MLAATRSIVLFACFAVAAVSAQGTFVDDPSCHTPGPPDMPHLYPADFSTDCFSCVSNCADSDPNAFDCCVNLCDKACAPLYESRCDLCSVICQANAMATVQDPIIDQDACMNNKCNLVPCDN